MASAVQKALESGAMTENVARGGGTLQKSITTESKDAVKKSPQKMVLVGTADPAKGSGGKGGKYRYQI